MALEDAVEGGLRPSQVVTWTQDEEGTAFNLTGATLTGKIRNMASGVVRSIAGTLTVTDGAGGVFLWTYHADDVADDGSFTVQFTAAFASSPTPARSFAEPWTVRMAQTV